ncbi:MAG: hypothetical protein VCA38_15800 [Roseibacillus sp.]
MNRPPLFFAAALLSCTQLSHGVSFEQIGSDKNRNYQTIAQPGWPAGLVKILNHDSRVYSVDGTGHDNFYFKSNPDEIAELIKRYSQTRLREHILTIKKGKPEASTFKKKKISYNVHFYLLDGIALGMTRQKGLAETLEPTLTIHVDVADDLALLRQIVIPDHLIARSEVPGWPVKSKAKKAKRSVWHAEVVFDNKLPAIDFETGLSTTVTLWEKDSNERFNLGKVSYKGLFNAAFSETEIEALKAGRMWLTLTVGNWLTKAKREDLRLDLVKMSIDPRNVVPVEVAKPRLYHGRVLFDDGSPAILDPAPWQGARIAVSFPYAGMVNLDKKGYFQLYFTPDQYAAMKARKIRKNIYLPDLDEKGSSRALYAFPAMDLSLEKEKAGVIRIAKPRPNKKDQ